MPYLPYLTAIHVWIKRQTQNRTRASLGNWKITRLVSLIFISRHKMNRYRVVDCRFDPRIVQLLLQLVAVGGLNRV